MQTTKYQTKQGKADNSGVIFDTQGNLYGFKCLMCSTAHVPTTQAEEDNIEELVSMWIELHEDCRSMS